MTKRLSILVALGASVGFAMLACNGETIDDDGGAGETATGGKGSSTGGKGSSSGGKGSGGKGSGGKGSGGKGSGGAATGGMGGAPSGGAATGGEGGEATGGMGGSEAVIEALCEDRCQVTIQLECPGWDDLSVCTSDCVAKEVEGCESQYRANVECESNDDPDGFQCVEVFEDVYYYVAQSGTTACESTYNAYLACAAP